MRRYRRYRSHSLNNTIINKEVSPMPTHYDTYSTLRRLVARYALFLLAVCSPVTLHAQSNCAADDNGDFKPTRSMTCQLPESGEFSFKDVVIPPNVNISFARNSKNTPVTLRISGNLTLNGRILVHGANGDGRFGGKGGPGGFDGGKGGSFLDSRAGIAGDGPGGGQGGPLAASGANYAGGGSYARSGGAGNSPHGAAGPLYGSTTLLPLIGGSGGGGGGAGNQGVAGGGGGGGGALLIYCSGTATFRYLGGDVYGLYAQGGSGQCGSGDHRSGSGGSGGAIRVVADAIIGNPGFDVRGGDACNSNGYSGGEGYIRVEARDLSQFTSGAATITTSFVRGPVMLANTPQLKIKSVGGQTVPADTVGSLAKPDITVPTSVTNPVNVIVEGTNIPATTAAVQVTLIKESGERETQNCALNNQSPRTCNVNITLPERSVSVITASVTLDVLIAFGRPMFIDSERVNKVEIAAAFGGPSEVTYITESGRRLKWPQ
jgi:hypothetical protein